MTDYTCPYCDTYKQELTMLLSKIAFLEKGIEAYRYSRGGNSQFVEVWESEARNKGGFNTYNV